MKSHGSGINGAGVENPSARPSLPFVKCVPCPCGAGSCRLLTSTKKYAGRGFYKCPLPASKQCQFFKWADEVEPHEFIEVPYCGGCMAGVCRYTTVKTGADAGRILFTCKIKEGHGSCGFKGWKDELHLWKGAQKIETSSKSSLLDDNNSGPASNKGKLKAEWHTNGTLHDDKVVEAQSNATSLDDTEYGWMKTLRRQEFKFDESSRQSQTESLNGNMKGLWSSFYPKDMAREETTKTESYSHLLFTQDCNSEISGSKPSGLWSSFYPKCASQEETTVTESYSPSIFTHNCNSESSGSKTCGVTLDEPLSGKPLSETTLDDNLMRETISKSFKVAAEQLQNDLLARLEAMDFKDHEIMSKAAEATFSALDRLFFDCQPLKDRVKELINRAMSLSKVQQLVLDKCSYDKMVDHFYEEGRKLDEIDRAQAQAAESVDSSWKRLKMLQKEVCSAKKWLVQAEAELSFCKMEMDDMEHRLDQIDKEKEILRQNFVAASEQWKNAPKVVEQREGERGAAKAAFDKARELLRR